MKASNPLISIVVPTYDHGHFLEAALRSIQLQTYSHWEVFVVNNFSHDDTIEVVERFRDARMRLVNFSNNGVIAASRNEGIRLAQGDHVAFLDADDLWKGSKLEKCVEKLNSGCQLVCHGTVWRWEDGKTRDVLHGPEENASYESLLYRGNRLATSATVIRREILEKVGGFSTNPKFITAEDYELWLRIAKANYRFCFIPETLGEYRIHKGNAGRVGRVKDATLAVLEHHFGLESGRDGRRYPKRQKRRAEVISSNAWELRNAHHYSESIREFGQALRKWPLSWRTYVAGSLTIAEWAVGSLIKRPSRGTVK